MTRIHGLDLARALAIIGMMAAHIGPGHPVTEGYPSVLFAVLAGVSMGIISRGSLAGEGDLPRTRFRLILRGVILVGLGAVLSMLQSSILVVLTAIGVSYILLTPVITWSTRRLGVLLAVLVVTGPVLVAAEHVLSFSWGDHAVADLFLGVYPLLAWLAYTLVGLLIHRLVVSPAHQNQTRRQIWLAAIGLALLAGTQLLIELTGFRVGPNDILNEFGAYLQGEPHSGGLLDVLGSSGAAMAVIGLCVPACRAASVVWASYPLRAMGSMSLTMYVVHVVVTTIANGTFLTVYSIYGCGPQPYLPEGEFGGRMYTPLSDPLDFPGAGNPDALVFSAPDAGEPDWLWLLAAQVIGLLIFASLWRRRFRRGPLEWGMHRVIEGAVGGTSNSPTAASPRG
ncbi:acyltransferase family protein [Corynebacterium comes]|uniref:Acyltransferase family protein n=1 Tax=Corynebacterium comes TaxID=2675218 RepID=A0A6B8VG88_9CORY|nr:acyltransferase family protein [Corynebacterium comes]QGU04302.1 Acyltransferase family protein [Corynebacterium comes]